MTDGTQQEEGREPRLIVGWRGEVDVKLLEMLACPLTKAPLRWNAEARELVSRAARVAYPVRDGVPIMLPSEARRLDDDEIAE